MGRNQSQARRAARAGVLAFAVCVAACAPPSANPGSPEDFISEKALPAVAAGDMDAAKALGSPLYVRASRPSEVAKVGRMIERLGPLQDASAPVCRQIIGFNIPTGQFHRAECRVEARHAIANAVYAFSLRAAGGRWMMDGFNVNSTLFLQLMGPSPADPAQGDASTAP